MRLLVLPLLASLAFAANPQDEQTVRNAYAKLAYAVQSRTVYDAVRKNPGINSVELTKELQTNECGSTSLICPAVLCQRSQQNRIPISSRDRTCKTF
jgi:hypothetical protein